MNMARKMARKPAKLPKIKKSERDHAMNAEVGRIIRGAIAQAVAETREQTVEECIMRVLGVAVGVIWNDWGKLQKKDTRLKVFGELYRQRLEELEHPSKSQLEAEAELFRQTGWKLMRADGTVVSADSFEFNKSKEKLEEVAKNE